MWPCETAAMVLGGWLCVTLLAAVSADTEISVYKKLGDEVVLKSDTTAGTITNIMWKHGENIAVQWDGVEVDRYRQFRDRGDLNISTGDLTIKELTKNDSGLYTPEINNMINTATHLFIISPVQKPDVGISCDDETSCILSCDGETTGAEPVSYSWMSDDKVLGSSKMQHISKATSLSVTEFRCKLSNPVSQELSAPLPNPFIVTTDPPAGKLNISTGVTVFISLLIAVLLLVAVHRCKAGMWFFQKSSMPWEADFWRKHERESSRDAAESNGRAAQGKGEADEETPMK